MSGDRRRSRPPSIAARARGRAAQPGHPAGAAPPRARAARWSSEALELLRRAGRARGHCARRSTASEFASDLPRRGAQRAAHAAGRDLPRAERLALFAVTLGERGQRRDQRAVRRQRAPPWPPCWTPSPPRRAELAAELAGEPLPRRPASTRAALGADRRAAPTAPATAAGTSPASARSSTACDPERDRHHAQRELPDAAAEVGLRRARRRRRPRSTSSTTTIDVLRRRAPPTACRERIAHDRRRDRRGGDADGDPAADRRAAWSRATTSGSPS